jgi:hypothetical protein
MPACRAKAGGEIFAHDATSTRARRLCPDDGDFYDPIILSYCTARGSEVCNEPTLLERLTRVN